MSLKSIILKSILLLFFISACENRGDSSSKEKFQRHIKLEGQSNFRDLGNYKTVSGERIKTGVLYRSGTLANISEMDKKVIESLGIRTVVNFLTEEEIAKRGSDNLPSDVRSVYLPIDGNGNEISKLILARQTGDFTSMPVDFNYQIHKILPETGKNSYAAFFKVLADSTNYPIAFHCSHGVHRTGTAAALMLNMIGVPWEMVVDDYMLSKDYRQKENLKRINQLDSIARNNDINVDFDTNKANIEAFYILEPEYLEGTKYYIEEVYGSFENYFNQIGLSAEDVQNIRHNLIEK